MMRKFDELIVMSSARPGRETEYVDWYVGRHLPDMRAVPGVLTGAFFRALSAPSAAPGAFLARYRVEDSLGEVLGRVFSRAGKEDMPLTDAMDSGSVLMLGATCFRTRGATDGVATSDLLAAFSTPMLGQAEAFDAWYDDRHLPDVLSVPGVLNGARYTLARETAGKPAPWEHAALYAVAPGEAGAVAAELRARAGGPQMPISPALDRTRAHVGAYERLA